MKHLLFIAVTAVLLAACGNKQASFKQSKADTCQVIALFQTPKNGLKLDAVYRVTKDTMTFVNVDENTQTKKWRRDTLFYVPLVDTLTVRLDSLLKKDSTYTRVQWTLALGDAILVASGSNRNGGRVDSALKNFKK